MGQQEGFHLHLPPFHDVSHLVMHLWEETLEGRFVADYLENWWGLLMRRPQEEEGRNFLSLYSFLRTSNILEGRTVMFPNFSLNLKGTL